MGFPDACSPPQKQLNSKHVALSDELYPDKIGSVGPTWNDQIVRMSEIGPCQTHWLCCVHMVVYNMTVTELQSINNVIRGPPNMEM